ncbi:hypothetical protein PFICI_10953 [Pestalotiopsis fici W106-1]|uniref:Uncharacterized protein n=1 Tax=Pestalotiopsis fici (strain W106-1 / CGMCC3.15140) TaxID=1229662 RepID=W3WTD9_PESFW|nr:uncharacterized protein PFICI_10953 [Pestalotiopsis fici W106-1]ETS77079.1 hypothetical protein PFICI_10953 [Pestalotiopsis fici W106-1]
MTGVDTGAKATINERTRLIATIRVTPQQGKFRYGDIERRYAVIAVCSTSIAVFIATIIWSVASLLLSDSATENTPTINYCFNTSTAYASAEALNNNIDAFCQDVADNARTFSYSRVWTKIYYSNTPEEYKMTVALSKRTSGFDRHKCIASMSSIVNKCDIDVSGSTSLHWKHGGGRVQEPYEYTIEIARHNRPWPPPSKPLQHCEGWYKFIFHHFDIYGAAWASHDWGQRSLLPAINPCCGPGSLTGWGFEYFDQPDENGHEWHAWFNTALGTRGRCFDNSIVQCTAGGPCDSYCIGN